MLILTGKIEGFKYEEGTFKVLMDSTILINYGLLILQLLFSRSLFLYLVILLRIFLIVYLLNQYLYFIILFKHNVHLE